MKSRQETVTSPAKKLKHNLFSLLILSLVLALGVLVFTSWQKQQVNLMQLQETINAEQQLITQKAIYKKVIYTKKKEKFILEKSALFSVKFEITAGVDLQKGWSVEHPLKLDFPVIIILPQPEIFDIVPLQKTLVSYFVEEDFFTKFKLSDYSLSLQTEEEKLRASLDSELILQGARNKLEQFFRLQFAQQGFHNITFQYKTNGS